MLGTKKLFQRLVTFTQEDRNLRRQFILADAQTAPISNSRPREFFLPALAQDKKYIVPGLGDFGDRYFGTTNY